MPADTYIPIHASGSSKEGSFVNVVSALIARPHLYLLCLFWVLFMTVSALAGGYTDTHDDGILTGWTVEGSRSWNESGGYVQTENSNNSGFLINDYACQDNGTFTATIRSLGTDNSRYGGIVFRYTNTTNFYYLALQENNYNGQTSSNEIRIFSNTTDWNSTPIVTYSNLDFTGMNRHYPIIIEMDGSTFTVYLDDVELGSFSNATHSGGSVGYGYSIQHDVYVALDQSSWDDAGIDYTWDINTAGGIQTGNGTWGVDSYWSETEGDGTTLIAWPNENAFATFGGIDGAYTITVSGRQVVAGLTFLNSGYTLIGDTLDLTTNSGLNVAALTTISAVIDGSGGIKKNGVAELRLSGNNTFTGAVYIEEGKVTLLHANALGSTTEPTTISSGVSAIVCENITYAAEPLLINGTGNMVAGALRTAYDPTVDTPTLPGTVTLQSNSSLGASNSYDQLTISGVISGGYQLTTDGDGTIVLSGANTFSGGLVVNDGILKAANSSALGAGGNAITVNSGAAIDVNGLDLRGYSSNITINGQIDASTGALINSGSDQLYAVRQIALGSNASIGNDGGRFDIGRDYTGTRITGNNYTLTKVGSNFVALLAEASGLAELVINGGHISLEHANAAGSAPITINSGGTLITYYSLILSNNITMAGGNLSSSTNSAYDTEYSGTFSISGSNTFHNNNNNTLTISGAMSGTGSVMKTGVGELVLSGANTYTGVTTILDGSLWTSSLANGGSTSNLGASTSDAENLVIDGGTLVYKGGAVSSDRLFTIGTGGATIDASGTGALNLTNTGTAAFSGSGTRTVTLMGNNAGTNILSAIIGDNGGATDLVKSGSGTWRISASNTYSGGSTINSGILDVTHDYALGPNTNATTLAGGTLHLGVDLLSLQTQLNLTGTASVTSSNNVTLASAISGSGTMNSTNTAGNVISLAGDLTNFTGTLNHDQGTLRFASSAAASSADSLTVNLSGTGVLKNRFTSSVELGALSGTSGTYLQANGADGAGTTTFYIGYLNSSTTFGGIIQNDTRLTAIDKVGSGTLTLSGTNTHTGATTVSEGTLMLSGSIASGSAVSVASGATLAGTGTAAGPVSISGGATVEPGNSGAGALSTGNLTLDATSVLNFELGTASDSVKVSGDLTLDGRLNVTGLSGFAGGTYTLMTYSGTLTNNQLELQSTPQDYPCEISTATAGEVRLIVTEVNVAPTDISLSSNTVVEGEPIGTLVGELSATDQNSGESFTYALVSGTGSGDNGSFSISGNQLLTAEVFDYDTKSSYSIRVRVTDQGGLTYEEALTISVSKLGKGLTGQYWDNNTNNPGNYFSDWVMNRRDTIVSFNWGTTPPDPSMGAEYYAVRWQGQVRPEFTEAYTFYTYSDDGARLWVNDALIIDEWGVQSAVEHSGTLSLNAGTLYDIKMEYHNAYGDAVVELRWSSSSQGKEIIPKTNLYPLYPPDGIYMSNSSLMEGRPSGTVVGTFTTTDSTFGDSHTYSLVSGTGSTDNASFSLSGDTLKTAAVLDYETKSTYSIRVRSTDMDTLFYEGIITVSLEDSMEGTIVTVDADGGADYTSLDAVLTDIKNGTLHPDYVHFIGGDQDTYTWSVAGVNQSIGSIVFIGDTTNPDMFPIINHTAGDCYSWFDDVNVTFENLILTGSIGFRNGQTSMTYRVKNCVIRNNTGNYFFQFEGTGNTPTVEFTNCLFEGNTSTEIIDLNFWGSGSPRITIANCTFDNNTRIFSNDEDNNANFSFVNNIFINNGTTFSGSNLRSKTSYSLTDEATTGYGTGCVSSSNPQFAASTRTIPSDWAITHNSPAINIGTLTNAAAKDISGYSRAGIPDAGCWELQTADYTWDSSTDADIQGANGTWGTDSYWTLTGEGGTSLSEWPGEGNSATFAGSDGPYTVSVNGTQYVDSITFNASDYTIGGGTLAMSGRSAVVVAESKTATISSIIAGSDGLNIFGLGGLTLSGANTFTGVLTITDASVSVSSLANGGTSSPLGASTNASSNIVLDGSTLRYTGGSVSWDRLFSIATDAVTIDASGSGPLNLTNTGSMGLFGAGTRTLILDGTNTGDNTLASVIGDNGGATSLTKTGGGNWILTAAHTFSGATTISDGTLVVNGSTSLSSAVTVGLGATLAGTGTVNGTVNATSGTIAPGDNAVGTLATGALTMGSSSVLNLEMGSVGDSIKVNGNLTLDGTLNLTGLTGFVPGEYTIMTYTGSLTDNGLIMGTAPQEYMYTISASGGAVVLTVQSSRDLLPITVSHNIGASSSDTCLVHTTDWSIVFDEDRGGQITFLSNQSNGAGTNQVWNTTPENMFSVAFNQRSSAVSGTLSIIDLTSFHVVIHNTYTLNSVTFTEQYTVHGSGRIFINVTAVNNSGANQTQQLEFTVTRDELGASVRKAASANAGECPYVLNAEGTADQFDILLAVYDLWADATGFINTVGDNATVGYFDNSYTFSDGAYKAWDFMVDFSSISMNDTSIISHAISNDYRTPDSLEFVAGTRGMEKAWEHELRGHWTFDDGVGDTARDHSGQGRHAPVTGSFTDGRWNGALSLNGSQSATCPDHADFDGYYHMAVMGWVKTSTFDANAVVAGKHNGTTGWKITGNPSGQLSFHIDGDVFSGVTNIGDDSWHHIAASYTKEIEEVKLYVDGKPDAVYSGRYGATENTSNVVMGDGVSGLIDDIRYYGRPVSEHTLKSIYQLGYRSSQGMYHLRADNNNTVHVMIDGANPKRYFPVFMIDNYWSTTKPSAGCVVLNGTAMSEGSDYHASVDSDQHRLFVGLNKIIGNDEIQVYIDDNNGENYQRVGETPKMSWGVDNSGANEHFWVKNFGGSTFGDASGNQWYLNWKMTTAGNSKDGEIWHFAGSVTDPATAADTTSTTNLIPGYDQYNDGWGQVCFNIDGNWPKSTWDVTSSVSYTVVESSDVRVVLRLNQREVAPSSSFNLVTQWALYPTGQIFRYDSVYTLSGVPITITFGAFVDDSTYSTAYTNRQEKRAGLLYSQGFPDFAHAWLGLLNATSLQAQPFDSDTISVTRNEYRAGVEFADWSATSVWNSTSLQVSTYLDIQHTNMESAFIDSVSNSVQYIGMHGGAALDMRTGTLLSGGSATEGDLEGDGFNQRDGTYRIEAANNTVDFMLPAHGDTCRFNPAFTISNYYAAQKPQYVHAYTATDTVTLMEGYQYNAFYDRENHRLIIQIDSVFCDTVGMYISADVSLAVKMSSFWAKGGDGCDTIGWRTESEQENLGYYLHRRVKPAFYDTFTTRQDSLPHNFPITLFKQRKIVSADTGWIRVNQEIIPGAQSGVSQGPRDYLFIDHDVYNNVLYEYRLEAIDYENVVEKLGPVVQVMPMARMPLRFRLGSNYPNPFRGVTAIRFELPIESRMKLNIYDLQGRLVRKLITPDKPYLAGYHQIYWDGTNDYGRPVGSGPFVYRFSASKYSKTRLMIKVE